MTIVVLCKWCPDPADLEVRSDGSISLERARWSVSEYDRVALEVARQLAVATPDLGSVAAMTAGPASVDSSLARKAILSRGPDALTIVADDRMAGADARQTAIALAAGLGRLPDVRLVLCGAGSADLYAQQVGIQVGECLGWPTLNEVRSVTVEADSCRVERRAEDAIETLEVALPAVLAVTSDAAVPRVPSMRDILAAGKRPASALSLADLGLATDTFFEPTTSVRSTNAPRGAVRRQILFEGSTEEAVQQLVGALRQEGVL